MIRHKNIIYETSKLNRKKEMIFFFNRPCIDTYNELDQSVEVEFNKKKK